MVKFNFLIIIPVLVLSGHVKAVNFVFKNKSGFYISSISYPNSTSWGNSNKGRNIISLDTNYPKNTYIYNGIPSNPGVMPLAPESQITTPDCWPVNGSYIIKDTNGYTHTFNVQNLTGIGWNQGSSSATISDRTGNQLILNINNQNIFENASPQFTPIANCAIQAGTTCNSCSSGYILYNNACYTPIANCANQEGTTCSLCNSAYSLSNNTCTLQSTNISANVSSNQQNCPIDGWTTLDFLGGSLDHSSLSCNKSCYSDYGLTALQDNPCFIAGGHSSQSGYYWLCK